MCFVKPKNDWGLIWPNWEELFLDLNQIWKESPIEILRKTPKTREQINFIIEEKVAKISKKDNWDKI